MRIDSIGILKVLPQPGASKTNLNLEIFLRKYIAK